MRYVITVQFPSETYQPLVFGPFATRIQALAWKDRQLAKGAAYAGHYHVTLLESVEDNLKES